MCVHFIAILQPDLYTSIVNSLDSDSIVKTITTFVAVYLPSIAIYSSKKYKKYAWIVLIINTLLI